MARSRISDDAETIARWLEADAEETRRTLARSSGADPAELKLRMRLARKFARHIREGRPWDPAFGGSPKRGGSSAGT